MGPVAVAKSFAKSVFGGKITLNNTDKDQNNFLVEIMSFKQKITEKLREKNAKKERHF